MVILIAGRGQLARSLEEIFCPARIRLITAGRPELDLLNEESIARILDRITPDIVVNTAAYTAVDRAEGEPELAFAVNSDGVERLASACASRGIPVIHLSTDYVYDGTKGDTYVETDPTNPKSVYGRSKLSGERKLAEANPRHIILRTAWLYAPLGTNFVRTMLHLASEREEIHVVDDQIGNPTYAPHLSEAILTIIEHIYSAQSSPWGIYHLAGTGETSWFGFAQEIFNCRRALGHSTPSVRPLASAQYHAAAPRPANSRLNSDKFVRTFGQRLPTWQQGVAECLDRLERRGIAET